MTAPIQRPTPGEPGAVAHAPAPTTAPSQPTSGLAVADPLDTVLDRLDNLREQRDGSWMARCPAHPDNKPSLKVDIGDNDALLLKCFAGCANEAILSELDLTWTDLYPAKETTRNGQSRIVGEYDYPDEDSNLLFQVVRLEPKGFRQRRSDGRGGWVWSLGETRRVLYRLPAVIAAVAKGEPVVVVEGEKDVHALEAAGHVATCNPGGADKWRPEFTETLRGAEVVVVADKDKAGRRHAREVAAALDGVAASVRCVEAHEGKDISDHLAAGLTVEELDEVDDRWLGDDPGDDGVDASLVPLDLGAILSGRVTQPVPTMLRRTDAVGLFYPGMVNGLHGDSGDGKSWIAHYLVAENARAGLTTVVLDFEDTAESVVSRLLQLGLTAQQIAAHVVYLRPQVALGTPEMDHLCRMVTERSAAAVVIDSMGEAFALEGINENNDSEVAPWFRRVPRRLAEAGPAVALIDHGTKAKENASYASGSKRKRAAITGASYVVEVIEPLRKGHGGRLRIVCAKDRHGTFARKETAATFVMSPPNADGITPVILSAGIAFDEPEQEVVLAARAVVRAAKAAAAPMSKATLEVDVRAAGLRASGALIRQGIDYAIAKGSLGLDRTRRAHLVSFVRDLDGHGTRHTDHADEVIGRTSSEEVGGEVLSSANPLSPAVTSERSEPTTPITSSDEVETRSDEPQTHLVSSPRPRRGRETRSGDAVPTSPLTSFSDGDELYGKSGPCHACKKPTHNRLADGRFEHQVAECQKVTSYGRSTR